MRGVCGASHASGPLSRGIRLVCRHHCQWGGRGCVLSDLGVSLVAPPRPLRPELRSTGKVHGGVFYPNGRKTREKGLPARGGPLQIQMHELWGSVYQRGSGVPGCGSQHVPGTACSRHKKFSETTAPRLEGLWLAAWSSVSFDVSFYSVVRVLPFPLCISGMDKKTCG